MTFAGNNIEVGQYPISISDLQDRYFDGDDLSESEKSALTNFNAYRVEYLESAGDEKEFEKRYFELQIKANLSSYTEFLD